MNEVNFRQNVYTPSMSLVSNKKQDSLSFLVTRKGSAGRNDIFLCILTSKNITENLTKSPMLSEYWAILDSNAQNVIYYGVGESSTDLYLMNLSTGEVKSLTTNSGNSKLHIDYLVIPYLRPSISSNGDWIAFTAVSRKRKNVELFVASVHGPEILQVTDLNYQICDYMWGDNRTIIFTTTHEKEELQLWKASFLNNKFGVERLQ